MGDKRKLNYMSENSPDYHSGKHCLDIFYPDDFHRISPSISPILVFIHGGTWMNGSKEIYSSFGKNLAEKGIVAIIINYRLGDIVNFKKMATDCAAAVKWAYKNALEYGGNKSNIYICGHSAGGHLSALISLSHDYFDLLNTDNPIKGCILIDAFGLNIGNFIKDHGALYLDYIEKVFTKDPKLWDQASPIKFVTNRKIPFMILVGSRTYPILKQDNELFLNALKKYNPYVDHEVLEGKSHVEMISQLDNKHNPLYGKILKFLGML